MKVSPNLSEYLKYAKSNNLIVFSTKFVCDYLTPLSIYHRIRKYTKKEAFLLESVEGVEKISRFSFIGFDPIATFKSKDRNIDIRIGNTKKQFVTGKDPLYELKKLMSQFSVAPKESLRFFGGFVGYLGYDTVSFYEPIGKKPKDNLKTFDNHLILPKFLIVFDHLAKQVEILCFSHLKNKKNLKNIYAQEIKSLKEIYEYILKPVRLPILDFSKSKELKMISNFKEKDFIKAVKKAKGYIKNGDIIQVVLSQRFMVNFNKDPFLVYRYLRLLNPSPYMYNLDFKDTKIVGSSPEMLLRCEKKELTTRPIAGTRPRGKDEQEDKKLEHELLNDIKERAEHVMLVDLGRNDLGRVSKKGSVNVPIFMTVERFSHVMHIVSEAKGILDSKKDMFSALEACFPAGTVTGAPKVRAMQIINELEPQSRGIYAGSLGYFSFTKSLDTCIIIRTIIFKDNKAYIQAGAGIVADSVPKSEYKETVNKARAQVLALTLAHSNT